MRKEKERGKKRNAEEEGRDEVVAKRKENGERHFFKASEIRGYLKGMRKRRRET